MEVFNELFGDSFGGGLLTDSELNSDTLSFASSYASEMGEAGQHLRTLKVPLHAEVGDGNFPPVLSIPGSFAGLTAGVGGALQISISPISQQGADTTSLGSPPTTPSSASSSASSNKKTVFTAKGIKIKYIFPL